MPSLPLSLFLTFAAFGSADPTTCCGRGDSAGADRTCWGLGFHAASADGTKKCGASQLTRSDCDCHVVGADKTTTSQQMAECCYDTCYSLGWRANGDKAGSHECPAGTDVRPEHDQHRPSAADGMYESECCRQTCASSGVTCTADKKLMATSYGTTTDTCCKTTCDIFFGSSNPLTCPAGQMKRYMGDHEHCHGRTSTGDGACSAEECCEQIPERSRWNCWYHGDDGAGWRDGDGAAAAATGGTKSCPAGHAARGKWDGHMSGQDAGAYTEAQCCTKTCYAKGWRNAHGTDSAGGTSACPAGFRLSGGSSSSTSCTACDQAECCVPTCASSGYTDASACPAGTMFAGASTECAGVGAATTGGKCAESKCCPQSCQHEKFGADQCPAGLKLYSEAKAPEWGGSAHRYCKGPKCTPAECCFADISGDDGKTTCYDAGFRGMHRGKLMADFGAAGTASCPAGMDARGSDDGHACGDWVGGKSNGACYAADCCYHTCGGGGWRSAGDASGAHQCPADAPVARGVEDGSWCKSGGGCGAGDCCGSTCGAAFAGGLACPAGTQPRGGGEFCAKGECTVDKCCYVGCAAWAGAGNTCAKDAEVVKADEGCDGGSLSGCNADKCCGEPEACQHAQAAGGDVCTGFDKGCNAAWDKTNTAAGCGVSKQKGGAFSCDPGDACEATKDGEPNPAYDAAKCAAALEQCAACTPTAADKKCQACVYCYARNYFFTRLASDPAPCADDDAQLAKDSNGAIRTCAAGRSFVVPAGGAGGSGGGGDDGTGGGGGCASMTKGAAAPGDGTFCPATSTSGSGGGSGGGGSSSGGSGGSHDGHDHGNIAHRTLAGGDGGCIAVTKGATAPSDGTYCPTGSGGSSSGGSGGGTGGSSGSSDSQGGHDHGNIAHRQLTSRRLSAPVDLCTAAGSAAANVPPGWFKTKCCATCAPPTPAPTRTPPAPAGPAATAAPTSNPTFAPTSAATTPPLPVFDAAAEAAIAKVVDAAAVVVIDTAAATAYPTPAPTPAPTEAGYTAMAKVVERKTVKAAVTLAVSAAEAKTPAMRKSLEEGFAGAVGVAPDAVRVASVDGEAVVARRRARRRLSASASASAAGAAIEFEIVAETATTETLQANVKAAATSGAVVANVQKAAAENGVLTAELKAMPKVLPEPAVTEATTTVTIYEQVRPEAPEGEGAFSAAGKTGVGGTAAALAFTATIVAALAFQ